MVGLQKIYGDYRADEAVIMTIMDQESGNSASVFTFLRAIWYIPRSKCRGSDKEFNYRISLELQREKITNTWIARKD